MTTAAVTTTGLANVRDPYGDDPRRPCANTDPCCLSVGRPHVPPPDLAYVFISPAMLPNLPFLPWEERHQAIAATKAVEATTSLRGSEVSVFLQSKTCVERKFIEMHFSIGAFNTHRKKMHFCFKVFSIITSVLYAIEDGQDMDPLIVPNRWIEQRN